MFLLRTAFVSAYSSSMTKQTLFSGILRISIIVVFFVGFFCSCTSRRLQSSYQPSGDSIEDFYTFQRILYSDTLSEVFIPYLTRMVELYPNDDLSNHLLSKLLFLSGSTDSALVYATNAALLDSMNPHYLEVLYDLEEYGLFYTDSKNSHSINRLLNISSRLVELNPINPTYIYNLALNLIRNNQPQLAKSTICQNYRLLHHLPGTDPLLVNAYLQLGQCDSALLQTQSMVQNSLGGSTSFFLASEVALSCQRKELAFEYFLKGLRYGCAPWSLTEEMLQLLGLVEDGAYTEDVLESLRSVCTLSSQQWMFITNTLLYSVKKSVLQQQPILGIFDSVFLQFPNQYDYNLLQYRFYSYVTPKRNQVHLLQQLCAAEPSRYLWWNLLVREEAKWANSSNAPEAWSSLHNTILEMVERFPFDLAPVFLDITSLNPSSKFTKPLPELESRLKYYINHYLQLEKNTSRRAVYRIEINEGDTLEISALPAIRSNLATLYGYGGDYFIQLGRFDEAWKFYDQALGYDPKNPTILNNYAYYLSLYEPNRLTEAKKYALACLDLTGHKHPTFLDTYGYILYLNKDYEEARKVFIKLLSIDPNPGATVLFHYADVLEALGRTNSADIYRLKAQNSEKE